VVGPGSLTRRAGSTSARLRAVAALVVVLVATGGCGPDAEEDGSGSPTGSAGPDLSRADLWLSFDDDVASDGTPGFEDDAGGLFVGRVVSVNDGEVEEVAGADGTGAAISFPPTCGAATGCPRAMVEVMADASLDPGSSDFEYGAAVWLAPDQTTSGSNIVQKGRFGTDGGQWKLQVDNDEGQPSCVVRGDRPGAEPLVVRSSVTIADSQWHRVVCRRAGDDLTIEVDGAVDREEGETGSVVSEWPVRVGAPGVGDEDDQFHGRIDDVYLLVDRSR
jgi:hypothetical protein